MKRPDTPTMVISHPLIFIPLTLASFYTPEFDVVPGEYGVVVVWLGAQGQHFDWANFDFRVGLWSSLAAFTHSPKTGDVATVFDRALDTLIPKLEKLKFADTDRPRQRQGCSRPGQRHIPAQVKREVCA